MAKGAGAILGIAASIIIPFAAPAIAGAIGFSGTLGSTLVGAALGAGAAAATGTNPLIGALGGGFGGFMGGGGWDMAKEAFGNITSGFGGTSAVPGAAPVPGVESVAGVTTPTIGPSVGEGFGTYGPQLPTSYTPTATVPEASTGIASSTSNTPAYTSQLPVGRPTTAEWTAMGNQAANTMPGASASATYMPTASGTAAASGSGSSGFSLSSMGEKLLNNPTGLAQLAMTMFNKAPQSLTAAEKAALEDTARLAGENKALFEKRVSEAESLMNRRNNPEQAYAQTGMLVQRRLEEAQRGKPEDNAEAAARRAQIEGSRLGTLAASEAEKQSLANEQAGLAALPTTAPTGAAGLSLPIYAALDKRREAYNRDLANAVGGLFGNIYGKTAKA